MGISFPLQDSNGFLLTAGSSFTRGECEVVLVEAQAILMDFDFYGG